MGNACCGDRKGQGERFEDRSMHICDKNVSIYDYYGVMYAGRAKYKKKSKMGSEIGLEIFSNYFTDYLPSSLKLLNSLKNSHSPVQLILVNEKFKIYDEILVEIRYFSKGVFKIYIYNAVENNDFMENIDNFQEIYFIDKFSVNYK